MAWQLIFKAPDPDSGESWAERPEDPAPPSRKPVSMTLQLDPGTMAVVPGGADEEEDDD